MAQSGQKSSFLTSPSKLLWLASHQSLLQSNPTDVDPSASEAEGEPPRQPVQNTITGEVDFKPTCI